MSGKRGSGPVAGRLVTIDGTDWYRIDGLEHLDPFLVSVVSDGDLWMFASSTGTLTAGRIDADHALLPYETDDRIHRAAGITGPVTWLARRRDGQRELWRPFGPELDPAGTRSLAKPVRSNGLLLEERHEDWELVYRVTWAPSATYGWVRTVELEDLGGHGAELEVLDGLLDVMPTGVDARTEQLTSNLVDAYKRSEVGRWGRVAFYTLESLITDRAEPAEALAATAVWSVGLPGAEVHLDERVIASMRSGTDREPTPLLTGRRGCYLLRGTTMLPPHGVVSWDLVGDVGLGAADAVDLASAAAGPDIRARIRVDVDAGVARLEALLTGADASQSTGDRIADAHHVSNVLFNAMRGGVFPHAYDIPVPDLVAFLRDRNADVHARHAPRLAERGQRIELDELHRLAAATDDGDLIRLVLEYLPLTFSRRHGDPSRPWNRFSIRTTTDDGDELLTYEGNWRDIFQNWEALLRSYPSFHPHVVAKFLNASTVDGHNPYRISRDGIDWEVPDPDDPWSNIGYWGDHQIVYLLRLLESWVAFAPDAIEDWQDRRLFTYADVPYRIADHDEMIADPRNTITFDEERQAAVMSRADRIGADGKLVVGADGDPIRVGLIEKLLVPALAKLSAYVPGGGIWMNTQRPEWNDANNALVGHGLSMVTLYHLEQYLVFLRERVLASRGEPISLSRPIASWLGALGAVLSDHGAEEAAADARARRRMLDALGQAATAYRRTVSDGFDATPQGVAVDTVEAVCSSALAHLRATISRARRPDGLYDAYNLVSFPMDTEAGVEQLPPMLEGQVAALGSAALDHDEARRLAEALFDSPLYRADQNTFMLYPADRPGNFIDRNTIPPAVIDRRPVLRALVGEGAQSILREDQNGGLHFRPGLANAAKLAEALDDTPLDEQQIAVVQDVYEEIFDHHAFTGRSGGMYGYEGIGSVYWHMVSKLLLAVQERHRDAIDAGAPPATVDGLAACYRRIRDGLGFRKDPDEFGAVPIDCYSHTPMHAGAQQPGMTGQVKEEILARWGELGMVVTDGRIELGRALLPPDELLPGDGTAYRWAVCEVPFTVVPAEADEVHVHWDSGEVTRRPGAALTREESTAVFGRRGTVSRVDFLKRLQP